MNFFLSVGRNETSVTVTAITQVLLKLTNFIIVTDNKQMCLMEALLCLSSDVLLWSSLDRKSAQWRILRYTVCHLVLLLPKANLRCVLDKTPRVPSRKGEGRKGGEGAWEQVVRKVASMDNSVKHEEELIGTGLDLASWLVCTEKNKWFFCLFYFMHLCTRMCTMWVPWYPWRPEKGVSVRFIRTGDTNDCELPCRFWEPNPSPLQDQ